MGYEAYRELVFERQKQLGVITDKAELSPINPYIDDDERRREGLARAGHRPALGLPRPSDEKRLFARMAEVYAGLPEPRRPRDRPAARLPRGDRRARQHADRACLRQRRLRRGRPERVGQREQDLQRASRPDRGEPAPSSTSSAARRPTTTSPHAGRSRSTPRSSSGSATPTGRAGRWTR